MLYHNIPYHIVLYCIVFYPLLSIVLHSTVPCCTIPYCMVLYHTLYRYCLVLNSFKRQSVKFSSCNGFTKHEPTWTEALVSHGLTCLKFALHLVGIFKEATWHYLHLKLSWQKTHLDVHKVEQRRRLRSKKMTVVLCITITTAIRFKSMAK